MKNIETAIEAIEAEKKVELGKVNEYDDLITRLKNLQNGNFNSNAGSEDIHTSADNVQKHPDRKDFFKGYPGEMKLSDKLLFLATTLNKPFRSVTCLELIEEQEGKARREEYEGRISQQLNYLVQNMTFIGQKYGSNKNTFYFKRAWADWNGTQFIIRPEYEIKPEEFEAADIPDYKRKDVKWIVSKATANLLSTSNSPQ